LGQRFNLWQGGMVQALRGLLHGFEPARLIDPGLAGMVQNLSQDRIVIQKACRLGDGGLVPPETVRRTVE